MNIVEHVPLLHAVESSGYMPRSGMAGSWGNIVSSFLRNFQTDFQCGCTSLESHQQRGDVPLSPHPRQHMLFSEFLFIAILTGVSWNLRVVWIWIYLMTNDVQNFLRSFSAIWSSSGEKPLFSSVPHFW